ncbi:MAG: YggT family protein [Alphaproteobacteria bacterium]
MGLFEPFFYIIGLICDIYFNIVVVQVVLSWLVHFKVLKIDNTFTHKTMDFFNKVTEPVYAKIRQKIPAVNGLDFSPLLLLLVLQFLSRFMDRLSDLVR